MTAKISHIDHVAIAVESISQIKDFYEKALGLKIEYVEEIPQRGIRTAFITIGQTKIELIEPMNDFSEISQFLKKKGPGIHHIAFATSDTARFGEQLTKEKVQTIYHEPQKGAHDSKINFIHPKSSGGVLMELVEHS